MDDDRDTRRSFAAHNLLYADRMVALVSERIAQLRDEINNPASDPREMATKTWRLMEAIKPAVLEAEHGPR